VQIYLPIAEMSVSVFLIFGMSAAVGFLSGMFGVGGGFLMTPLLVFLGIPANVAVASGSAQVVATSVSGILSHWRRKAVDVQLGLVLVAGGLVGTLIGVWLFNLLRRTGAFDLVLAISYVVLLGSVGGLMLIESLRATIKSYRNRASVPAETKPAPFADLPYQMTFERSQITLSVIPVLTLGTLIGIAGAFLGIGGGFLVIPALLYFFRVPTSVVIGTSQFQILLTITIATMLHALTNQSVDIVLAIILIAGSVIGTQFGTRAGQNLKGEHFRLLLALLIFGVAMRFAYVIIAPPVDPFSLSTGARG
jgi:uncharacterized protein